MSRLIFTTIRLAFICILCTVLTGCKTTRTEKKEPYAAGFKILHLVDKARIYKPGTDTTDYLHYRQVDVDVWYPANVNQTDSPLLFEDILVLLEKRANYYTASQAYSGFTAKVAQSLCMGYKCGDSATLLKFSTGSFKNAPVATGSFPLVLYLCSYNGMSFENYSLMEKLASEGFVVASISSVGRYPGEMTMKPEDLMEQVNDAQTAILSLEKMTGVDTSGIGIVGYSWGGLAGAVLTGRLLHASCLVSLDGSEFHRYGKEKEDNTDFDLLRKNSEFKALHITIPYLRMESTLSDESGKPDSVYDFSQKLSGRIQILRIDSASHEDFSCLSRVVRQAGKCHVPAIYQHIEERTVHFLDSLKTSSGSNYR